MIPRGRPGKDPGPIICQLVEASHAQIEVLLPSGRQGRRSVAIDRWLDVGISEPHIPTMPTWTLIVTVFYATSGGALEPRGITSISGYGSELECNAAGVSALKAEAVNTKYGYKCIRGPNKLPQHRP